MIEAERVQRTEKATIDLVQRMTTIKEIWGKRRRGEDIKEEDFDSCSCVTCNTCHQSDCSCSEMSSASQSSRSSHSSDGSVETVVGQDDVRAREKELGARLNRKHSDIYIVNGSDVSKASTKISKKSSNYDPLPQNGITKVKHKKLSQS